MANGANQYNKFERRLLAVASLLEKLPPDKFDYKRWVGNDWEGKPALSCGTSACAAGWATTIPAIRRAGLRIVMGRGGGGAVCLRNELEWRQFNPYEVLDASKDALEKVFGKSSLKLFLPEMNGAEAPTFPWLQMPSMSYADSAKQVARNIRQYVATGRAHQDAVEAKR